MGSVSGEFKLNDTQGWWFTTEVSWKSKSNFRRKNDRKLGMEKWEKLSNFSLYINAIARQSRPTWWDIGDSSKPLSMRPSVAVFLWAESMLDTGNLSKSVLDALEGVAYQTDASVRGVFEVTSRVAKSDHRGFIALTQYNDQRNTLSVCSDLSAASEDLILQIFS